MCCKMFPNTIDVPYKVCVDSKYRIHNFACRLFELWPNRT